MAFNNKDIIDIQNGVVAPNDGIKLVDLFRVMALKHAGWLYNTEPDIVFTDPLSIQYKVKLFNVANQVIDNNQQTLSGLLIQNLIALGNTEATIDHLVDSDSNTWSNYLGDNLQTAFEMQAKITNAERNAYNRELNPQED